MNALQKLLSQMTGPSILSLLTDFLREYDPSFPKNEAEYLAALETLRNCLPEADLKNLDEYIAACDQEIISQLVYAGHLGYMANLNYFRSSSGFDFTTLDLDDIIKEHVMVSMPFCRKASIRTDEIYPLLPDTAKALLGPVIYYYCDLLSSGPKLAHYTGYVIANHFLPWVEPGYRADLCQTFRYQKTLEKYMGFTVFPTEP